MFLFEPRSRRVIRVDGLSWGLLQSGSVRELRRARGRQAAGDGGWWSEAQRRKGTPGAGTGELNAKKQALAKARTRDVIDARG